MQFFFTHKAAKAQQQTLDRIPSKALLLKHWMLEISSDVGLKFDDNPGPIFHDNTQSNLSWIYYKENDFDKALASLSHAEKLLPNDAEVIYHLGMTYYKMGSYSTAIEYLKKTIKLGLQDEDEALEEAEKTIMEIEARPKDIPK